MRRPEAGLADHTQGVVLLQEELPRGVEAKGERPLLLQKLLRALDDATHRLVPARLDQLAILAHERLFQPISGVVRLPAEEIFRVHPTLVDPVDPSTAHADNAPVFDCDIQGVAVGVEDGGRLHPTVYLGFGDALLKELVYPHWPRFARTEWRAFAPGLLYAVGHGTSFRHTCLGSIFTLSTRLRNRCWWRT